MTEVGMDEQEFASERLCPECCGAGGDCPRCHGSRVDPRSKILMVGTTHRGVRVREIIKIRDGLNLLGKGCAPAAP